MTAEREKQLREGGLLYRGEAAEVWEALDEARAQAACEHVWDVSGSEAEAYCIRCGAKK